LGDTVQTTYFASFLLGEQPSTTPPSIDDAVETIALVDLRVKPQDPEASIRVALRDVRCPRCNGYGRPRIVALAHHPSI
jgi:hypothetical protein